MDSYRRMAIFASVTDVLTGPGGRRYRITIRPRVVSNNQFTIRQLALMGAGLSFHVEPEIASDLSAGRLVKLLPKWSTDTLSVDALMPAAMPQPPKVRLAIEALRRYLDERYPSAIRPGLRKIKPAPA